MHLLAITQYTATIKYHDEGETMDVIIARMPKGYTGDGSDLMDDDNVFYWLEHDEPFSTEHVSPSDDWELVEILDTTLGECPYAEWMYQEHADEKIDMLASRVYSIDSLYQNWGVHNLIEALIDTHTALNLVVNRQKENN